MDKSESDSENETRLPIERLSEYFRAVSSMRGMETLSMTSLLPELEEITKRQLVQDLESLGFSPLEPFPRVKLAVALQEHLRQLHASYQSVKIGRVPIPGVSELIKSLRGAEDLLHACRAPVIEAAWEVAEHQAGHFLLGHGLFRNWVDPQQEIGVTAYRHQVEETRRIVEEYAGNVIAVHEVGLGKTITAILVLCELMLRESDLCTLILVPTSLKNQWAKEFSRCIDLPVTTGASEHDILTGRLLLLSIDTAKEERRAKLLCQRHWGLVIVDEGHLLRHEQTSRYGFVYALHARRRLLLTATPVHNSPYDIYHLANMIRPGTLGKKEAFTEAHMYGERHLLKPAVLQERLRRIVSQQRREETGLSFPERTIREIKVEARSQLEHDLYDEVLQILRGIYRRHLGSVTYIKRPSGLEQGVSQLVLVSILVLRELASHPRAALKTVSGPLLRKVQLLATATGDHSDHERLDQFLKKYSKVTWETGSHKKTDALLKRLPRLVDKYGRVIVYVEFRETQKLLVERLQKKDGIELPTKTALISYHGGLPAADKTHQIERFNRNERACFISTDAGGQGLNLQKGNVVVNFDFPWNPMRVEQRIGRVDRLEQMAAQVLIENYITVDTIEQYVYQILQKKLKVCQDVMGHVLPVIFRLRMRDIHYYTDEDVLGIGQTILSSRNQEDLRQRFLSLGQTIEEQAKSSQERWSLPRSWIDE